MIPFFSSVDLLFALSVMSSLAGLGSAVFLLARRQRSVGAPAPEPVTEPAEAPQPATA